MPFRAAVEMSFLNNKEQQLVCGYIQAHKVKLRIVLAQKIHKYASGNRLTLKAIDTIISGKVPGKPEKHIRKYSLNTKDYAEFFPDTVSQDEFEDTVKKALKMYLTEVPMPDKA
jgi:hypothetical protein